MRTAIVATIFCLLVIPLTAQADPCLVVYPDAPTVYHFEAAEYYLVGPTHPLYDPAYDRGGAVLIEVGTNEIPMDIYQAPGIVGFFHDEQYQGFFTAQPDFTLVIDGFSNSPCTYSNIVLVFDTFAPSSCLPVMMVDGIPAVYDPGCGWHCPMGELVVSTPTPSGNHFSDLMPCAVTVSGCLVTRIWAFDDENGNLIHDGGECFSAFSHDTAIPAEVVSWGEIKLGP